MFDVRARWSTCPSDRRDVYNTCGVVVAHIIDCSMKYIGNPDSGLPNEKGRDIKTLKINFHIKAKKVYFGKPFPSVTLSLAFIRPSGLHPHKVCRLQKVRQWCRSGFCIGLSNPCSLVSQKITDTVLRQQSGLAHLRHVMSGKYSGLHTLPGYQ